jgi:orotate phosphoribosyltransferase
MQAELKDLLAGRKGHFQMESGYHSEWWFELGGLLARPDALQPFVAELARRLSVHEIEAVCGPESGGARLAALIGRELAVEHYAAERIEVADATGLLPVKYRMKGEDRARVRQKRIAIVDDAISAGSAVRGTCADLIACGARPVAVGALFVFGQAAAGFAAENDLALEGILPMEYLLWKPAECPLCRKGVPVEKVSDASP